MAIKGVLFDFSGTLFRVESTESWLRAVLREAQVELDEGELIRAAQELELAGALPGGAFPGRPLSGDLAALWRIRDESATSHRAAYTGMSRQVTLPDPALHDALYERHMVPAAWQPYPDAAEVLEGLRARGIAIGVVSNIGWDLRPVFRDHGLDAYVASYVLSYEYGIQKPDRRLFEIACAGLGLDPRDVVMVGDSREADGGAAALGCAVHFVDHLPAAERPNGLRPVLAMVA